MVRLQPQGREGTPSPPLLRSGAVRILPPQHYPRRTEARPGRDRAEAAVPVDQRGVQGTGGGRRLSSRRRRRYLSARVRLSRVEGRADASRRQRHRGGFEVASRELGLVSPEVSGERVLPSGEAAEGVRREGGGGEGVLRTGMAIGREDHRRPDQVQALRREQVRSAQLLFGFVQVKQVLRMQEHLFVPTKNIHIADYAINSKEDR
mmetsp:Transcript_59808/g.177264  ORF Transcript_59808/g.177264 Transcript_59808/m.177264 type:complete len:206 (-) Transcript_59808:14-631(-)